MLIVFTTAPNNDEAEMLAEKIVEAKLAACVQVLSPMKSFYFWENAVQKDSEQLLLIKTLKEKYDALENFIKTHHCYETPEIVAVRSEKVSADYLNWMKTYLEQ